MESWYKTTLQEEYRKNPQLTEAMIQELRNWLQELPYLPQSLTDMELLCHIQSCDLDVEFAKRALQANYEVRSKAVFFKNRNPSSEELERSSQCLNFTLVKDIDGEGDSAIIGKLGDLDASNYHYDSTLRDLTMTMDLIRLEYGTIPGLVAIVDLAGFRFSHMIRVQLASVRHFMRYLQEGSPTKIKSFHLVNVEGSIIDKVMVILRPFISEKIAKVMHFHSRYETLYDHGIQRDKLPEEYGGKAGTMQQMTINTHDVMKTYTDYFKQEESIRIDESKRPKTKYFGYF